MMTDKSSKATRDSLFLQIQQASSAKQNVQRRILELLRTTHILLPLITLFVGVILALAGAISESLHWHTPNFNHWFLLSGLVLAIVSFALVMYRLSNELLRPLVILEEAIAHVTHGDPDVHMPLEQVGVLGAMVRDIDSINDELTDLYEDMDSRVSRHTTRLAQKTASLKILYDVAASVTNIEDVDELLVRYLRILKEMVNGKAATVRMVLPDNKIRLLGSIGLDNDILRENQLFPVQLCMCGTALSSGDILCENNQRYCSRRHGRVMFNSDEIEQITVPLEYHGESMGIYNIFVDRSGMSKREDLIELLRTIGAHLGAAVAKQRSDAQARTVSIMNERTNLAHELHDSLAQTLASLRFQVRMLQDSLLMTPASVAVTKDVNRIRNGLEEAHTELRELLNNFRAPVDERGLLSALEKLVERYQQETGISVFLQKKCPQVTLSATEEMQFLRIIQEALANIRKHAQAEHVRVLVSRQGQDRYTVLIEDDGVGFDNQLRAGNPGEHIGLSIMQERAQRLGGILRIESEPGEGTRVELLYSPSGDLDLDEASENESAIN